MSQRITPCIWFDSEAEDAARLYTTLFPDSELGTISRYDEAAARASGQREGGVLTVDFDLAGQGFVGLNGGPFFELNPSISFHVKCSSKLQVDYLWSALSDGGEILMPLGEYPFGERFGWCNDRYGVSWQLVFTEPQDRASIVPFLLFVGDVCGRAEEAINFYASVFQDGRADVISRYGPDEKPDTEGSVQYATLTIDGQQFGAMDSAYQHDFEFNEAMSFIVNCENQPEIDYFWDTLTADGGQESKCGWLKDRYGVSWQIIPRKLVASITAPDIENAGRAMKAMLEMKKLDIAQLEAALGS